MKRILVLVLAFLLLPSLSIADPQLDSEPGVQPRVLRGIQGGAGMIPLETTPASGAGGATEAKQDALNALIVIIDAVLDAIKLDTANISNDQATATLQTTLNSLITTIDAVLDLMLVDTGNIDTNTTGLAGTVSGSEQQVDIVAGPTGVSALEVQGTAADGAAVAGNPNRIAGKSSAGNTEDIAVSPEGELALVKKETGADGFANTRLGSLYARTGESQILQVAPSMFNGTSWDLLRGDLTNGLFVNVKTSVLPAGASTSANQTTGNASTTAIELNTDSPTGFASATFSVGTSALEIAAASSTRRSLLVRNADSNTVLFVGPTSGVTTANGIPIGTAGASGANGNGGTITYSHTAAVWAIVGSGTADTRTQSESD